MMRVCKIVILWVTMIVVASFVACSNETDSTLNSQQNSIVNYLKGSHQPRLIPESEIGNSLDDNPEFYTQWGLDIFRYVSTYYDEDRSQRATIEAGDIVELQYTAYIFRSSKPSTSDMFATNKQESINQLVAQGLNTSYEWTTEPLKAKIGNGDIMESLEIALEGCHEGDSVEVYLTFESAYGHNHIGMVPSKSAQVWYIDIKSVTKK
ncbi:MAG: FKBP-type peptidyl-prolyl cis-trans isomerase [Alistipes sp.]|nr:FKBP-type peptidyl-prolyl cis-trans isomerase [Alistipes sp.]MBO7307609.1 FKBP-type peptidyl-prolyl cis-trans isomerase [Alistipes sp.]